MLARERVGSNGRMEMPGFPQEFARTRTRRGKARRQENQSDRFRWSEELTRASAAT